MNTLFPNKRLLSIPEAKMYTGLGESKLKTWARSIGAVGKIGRRTVFDRVLIDEHIHEIMETGTPEGEPFHYPGKETA